MTQDSIGCLKTLCMSVLMLSGGVESEWKSCRSPLSIKKHWAFTYESSFINLKTNKQTGQLLSDWDRPASCYPFSEFCKLFKGQNTFICNLWKKKVFCKTWQPLFGKFLINMCTQKFGWRVTGLGLQECYTCKARFSDF